MITTITITLDHALLDVDLSQRLRRMLSVDALIDRHHETPWQVLREAVQSEGSGCITTENTQGWVAGWNIPGCLPDDVPQLFAKFEDACEYLAEELERGRDDRCERNFSMSQEELCKLRQLEQEYDEAAAQVRGKMNDAIAQPDEANPFWLALRQHVWWVAREQ